MATSANAIKAKLERFKMAKTSIDGEQGSKQASNHVLFHVGLPHACRYLYE